MLVYSKPLTYTTVYRPSNARAMEVGKLGQTSPKQREKDGVEKRKQRREEMRTRTSLLSSPAVPPLKTQ